MCDMHLRAARVSLIVVASSLALSVGALTGCSSSDSAASGDDNGGATPDAGGGEDADAASTGDASPDAPVTCTTPSGCNVAVPACAGLVDNAHESKPGLRISQLAFQKPTALTIGIAGAALSAGFAPNVPSCELPGTATANWLLQIGPGEVKMGAALPVADPTAGYAFTDRQIDQLHVQPVVWNIVPDASGHFVASSGVDANLPIFLDADASLAVTLPVRSLEIDATLDPTRSCIGGFDPASLDPKSGCAPVESGASLTTGSGTIDGWISLEEADGVILSTLGQSLCVVLSGDPAQYGDGASPARCKRDGNDEIAFLGDACSNASGCHDAVTFSAKFAASSVKIHD